MCIYIYICIASLCGILCAMGHAWTPQQMARSPGLQACPQKTLRCKSSSGTAAEEGIDRHTQVNKREIYDSMNWIMYCIMYYEMFTFSPNTHIFVNTRFSLSEFIYFCINTLGLPISVYVCV